MDFAFDDTTRAMQERLLAFMDECVYGANVLTKQAWWRRLPCA